MQWVRKVRQPILDGQENRHWMVKKTHFGWSRKPMAVIFTWDKNWPHCRLFTFPLSSTMQASMCPASLFALLEDKISWSVTNDRLEFYLHSSPSSSPHFSWAWSRRNSCLETPNLKSQTSVSHIFESDWLSGRESRQSRKTQLLAISSSVFLHTTWYRER